MSDLSRRELIAAITAMGAAAVLGLPESVAHASADTLARRARLAADGRRLAAQAASIKPAGGDIGAIEHVVFLMLENRSYDHYFGAYPRGRGFDDHPRTSVGPFAQSYPGGTALSPAQQLFPFHLDPSVGEECTNDLTHSWGPQHRCWHNGKMDHWVKVHTSDHWDGDPDGAMTMGYYTRRELPFHWALADNFTLCDNYHSSIMGPTHPNRLMSISGTIDPYGHHGGPITRTAASRDLRWTCTWTTVQEVLEDKGVPWKVYHPSNANVSGRYAPLASFPTWNPALYVPGSKLPFHLNDNVLPYFAAFKDPSTDLHHRAFSPTFPNDFASDCATGALPSVSWIIPPLGFDEHPSSPPARGQWFVQEVLRLLMSNPAQWAKTVLFFTYDENDGWFDHVAPPTAPPGTPHEWLTAPPTVGQPQSILGPLGLGFRVPMLVISPFSRGGHIASNTYDHTSQMKFLAKRFGIEVPNLSAWRDETVGSLTAPLTQAKFDLSPVILPAMPLGSPDGVGSCSSEDYPGEGGAPPTIPVDQRMPTQQGTTVPATRYFPPNPAKSTQRRVPARSGRNTATTRSSVNALAHGDPARPVIQRGPDER